MFIDGTFKYEEEKDEAPATKSPENISKEKIKQEFPEISEINTNLLKLNIPCLIVSVKKNKTNHVASLHNSLCDLQDLEGIKIILYVEHTVDANDLPVALWRFCNNVDPKRDHHLYKPTHNSKLITHNSPCMGFDGTRKTKEIGRAHV